MILCCCAGCLRFIWTNETVVPHYDSGIGGDIPPYAHRDATYNGPCSPTDGPDLQECGPWLLADRPAMGTPSSTVDYVLNNQFEKSATEEDVSTDLYFKNYQARMWWCGRRGMDEEDDRYVLVNWDVDAVGFPITETTTDSACPTQAYEKRAYVGSAPTARYLSESRSLTIEGTFDYDDGAGGTHVGVATRTRNAAASINKYSGRITQDGYSDSATYEATVNGVDVEPATLIDTLTPWSTWGCTPPVGSPLTGEWMTAFWDLDAVGGRITGFDPCTQGGNTEMGSLGGGSNSILPRDWTAAEFEARMTYSDTTGTVTTTQSCDVTLTNTSLTISVIYDRLDTAFPADHGHAEVTFSKTLGGAYTRTVLREDMEALLALGIVTDHCKYPWRSGDCSIAPLMVYRGIQRTDFQDAFGGGSYTDPLADYYDGEVLGELLPAGYRNFFSFDHIKYDWNSGSSVWEPFWYGVAVPDSQDIPLNSTEWTDEQQRTGIYGPSCAFLRYAEGEGLWGMKRVEKKVAFPCINFFRPCGSDRVRETSTGVLAWDDADVWPICGRIAVTAATNAAPIVLTLATAADYLVTGDSLDVSGVGGNTAANGTFIVTVLSPTSVSLDGSSGNGAYTSGGFVQSTGSPSYVWHDETSKGDWQTREWKYDYRASGEYARLVTENASLSSNGCTSHTLPTDPGGDVSSFTLTQQTRLAADLIITWTPNGETFPGGVTFGFPSEADFPIDDRYGSLWTGQIIQAIPDPFYKQNTDEPLEEPKYVEPLDEPPVGAPTVHADVTIGCDEDTCAPPGIGLTNCDTEFYYHLPGTGI